MILDGVKHFLVSESHVQLNRSVKLDGILFELVIRSFGGDFGFAEFGFDHQLIIVFIELKNLLYS